ncbi:MAG: Dabb family protein [Cytophagaceae bacterium]|nr:Dabb family protein [Cytophagaceae bacterium]
MPTRRQFVQKSTTALAAGAALSSLVTPAEAAKPEVLNYGFIHHVFFWLKNTNNAQDKAQLLQALKDLGKIDVIRAVHFGTATKTKFDEKATDDTYAVSVALFFDNAKDEETYLYHPLHKKFIDANKHLWGKVMVFDSLNA